MNSTIRTAIQVGNSVAVTLPQNFVKPGKKLSITKFKNSLVIKPLPTTTKYETISDKELIAKFLELEEKYGELYQDLANIGEVCLK